MTRVSAEVGGVNLAQGLPDFDPPAELLAALARAIGGLGQSPVRQTWGLRGAPRRGRREDGAGQRHPLRPETEVTITCGVSEGVAAAVLALTEPGDEAIVLEPWYENYVPACVLAGVKPRFVRSPSRIPPRPEASGSRAITPKTRLILVNTPGQPLRPRLFAEELLETRPASASATA